MLRRELLVLFLIHSSVGKNTGKGGLEQQGPLNCDAHGRAFSPRLAGSEGSTDENIFSILEIGGKT